MIRIGVRIDRFTGEHAKEILKTNKEAQSVSDGIVNKAIEIYSQEPNKAYTLVVDEVPIICAGIVDQGFGNGEGWLFVSDLFYKHKILCHKVLKKAFPIVAKDMGLKRVQALVYEETNNKVNKKWIESFGFKLEGMLEKYGINGEDYFCYVRTF